MKRTKATAVTHRPLNSHDQKSNPSGLRAESKGNRYIEGHFEYVSLEPARWEAQE